ncbi:c-type cytochrome domain-containing protein [Dyadobacter tibetensis]|uniref:c-type cytochrome domain-containing protein n=1 Tax=Dyadobacter tibetensis TaxID=1211851 RepID=UPI00046F7DED|nr:c-type cytochrome domain-containing protein [Dyadobacter tibetensis]
MDYIDILSFIGRLHPLLVHLPIGFILLAAIFDWSSYWSRYAYLKVASSATLLLGAFSAIIASVLGWMLSWSGGYDDIYLNNHMFSGLSLCLLSILLYLVHLAMERQWIKVPKKSVSISYILLVGLLSYVGHQGGNLTHGAEYLAFSQLNTSKIETPDTIEEVAVYAHMVAPVLQKRCQSCHQDGKLKGELNMKNYTELLRGGKHGPSFTPGKPEQSELFKRITLDPDHEKFMPTEGKTPLTAHEVALIEWWIEHASHEENILLTSVKGYEAMLPMITNVPGLPNTENNAGSSTSEYHISGIPKQLDTTFLREAISKGFEIRTVSHNPVLLDISYHPGQKQQSPDLKSLQGLALHIVSLQLSDLALKDEHIAPIPNFKNLNQLNLGKNDLTDQSMKVINRLEHLKTLNLYGNPISGEGLSQLKELPNLKKVYVWQTNANHHEISAFQRDSIHIEFIF